jgi:ABC-type Fe3+ transport system substrate-binding protein
MINTAKKKRNLLLSSLIALASLGLAYIPIPGLETKIAIVSGTELTEPLMRLKEDFEQKNPDIAIEIKEQGSRDMINNFVDEKNDFKPTILIPADGALLTELKTRLSARDGGDPFYETPRPIATTLLVGIAWPERGNLLFPDGRFRWERIQQAMEAGNWAKIGGRSDWGSFDFLMTDPTRSHSGLLTLFLWSRAKGGDFNSPRTAELFKMMQKSVYQPPRSTDILLQEFITRGPNDADVATVYESIALYRQKQSTANQTAPYRVYYIDPTTEITATAAIVRRQVSDRQADAARKFLDFLREKEGQQTLIRYGFRPVVPGIDIASVPDNPWSQNIQGIEIKPSVSSIAPPDARTLDEIQRLWERSN